MKVYQMTNKYGRGIANQFEIYDAENGARYFQSYKSIIVKEQSNKPTELDKTYWNYSRTTSKYRNQFLNETTKETESKIKAGEYILTDLNNK